jgi:hypothetical protein
MISEFLRLNGQSYLKKVVAPLIKKVTEKVSASFEVCLWSRSMPWSNLAFLIIRARADTITICMLDGD